MVYNTTSSLQRELVKDKQGRRNTRSPSKRSEIILLFNASYRSLIATSSSFLLVLAMTVLRLFSCLRIFNFQFLIDFITKRINTKGSKSSLLYYVNETQITLCTNEIIPVYCNTPAELKSSYTLYDPKLLV